MEWLQSSPNLNPTENLWSVVKMTVANNITAKLPYGKQLKLTYRKLNLLFVKKITISMDYRLLAVIEKKGPLYLDVKDSIDIIFF